MQAHKARPLAGLVTSVIAGLLTILSSIALALLVASLASFLAFLAGEPVEKVLAKLDFHELGVAASNGILCGLAVVVSAILGYLWNPKLGGWAVIFFSVLSLFAISFFATLGLLVGVVGGILLLARK